MSAPALPPDDYRRPRLSLTTKLRTCLLLLGLDPDAPIEWDHVPSIAQRPWDEATQDFLPAFADPCHLIPMQKAAHREKTAKVDAPVNAKTRRIAKGNLAHRAKLLLKDEGMGIDEVIARVARRKRKWGSRKIQSRGFQKRT